MQQALVIEQQEDRAMQPHRPNRIARAGIKNSTKIVETSRLNGPMFCLSEPGNDNGSRFSMVISFSRHRSETQLRCPAFPVRYGVNVLSSILYTPLTVGLNLVFSPEAIVL